MEETDTKKILEAINSLKKEQEKEIQLLKKRTRKNKRRKPRNKKSLKKKSMHKSDNNFQEYSKNYKLPPNFYKNKNINKYIMSDMEVTDDMCDINSVDKEITP